MKKLFLITSLLFCSITFGQEIDIEFTINCEIVDQIVMNVEDGKPQRYGGIKDSFEVGDNFPIRVSFSTVDVENFYFYRLDIFASDKKMVTGYLGFNGSEDDVVYSSVSLSIDTDEDIARSNKTLKNLTADFAGQQFFEYDNATIGSKAIRLKEHGISLSRYYKDDWQLNHTNVGLEQSFIILGNCMGVSSEYNEILDVMESFEKEKYK